MDKVIELDLKVALSDVGRSIEEIIFCTIHPTLTGSQRREQAIRTFSEVCLRVIELIKYSD